MKLFVLAALSVLTFCAFMMQTDKEKTNPFFREWKTPFQTPPLKDIRAEHFLSAYGEGIRQQRAALDVIAAGNSEPTFPNTIETMEKSSRFLDRVQGVFNCLYSANTDDEMQKIANTTAPMLSKLSDDISMNPKLFSRVKKLYERKDAGAEDGPHELLPGVRARGREPG